MNVYDFSAVDNSGKTQDLAQYKGDVLLIVNTASRCGFTPQYKGLQALYDKYHDKGFHVLGFPCNQFANQEPGTDEEILDFCMTEFAVTFPIFAKIKVNGEDAHPLFKYLKEETGGILGDAIKWNFTKFLVDREGKVVDRFAPATTPEKIEPEILNLL